MCFTGTPCGPLLPLNRLRAKGLLTQTRTSPTAQAHIATTPAHQRVLVCTLRIIPAALQQVLSGTPAGAPLPNPDDAAVRCQVNAQRSSRLSGRAYSIGGRRGSPNQSRNRMKACTLRDDAPCGAARNRSVAREPKAAWTVGAASRTGVAGAAVLACTAVAPDVKLTRRRLDSGIGFFRCTCVEKCLSESTHSERKRDWQHSCLPALVPPAASLWWQRSSWRRQGM